MGNPSGKFEEASDGDDAVAPSAPAGHRTPGWVKVTGIVALVVVVALILILVFAPGGHGPGRHTGDHDGDAGHDVPDNHHEMTAKRTAGATDLTAEALLDPSADVTTGAPASSILACPCY